MGAGVGALGALVAATLKSRVAGQGLAHFSTLLLSVVPTTCGAAVLFTLGSGISREVRGARDWVNDFNGGAAAGAVLGGIKQQSLQGAFLGMLAFGCVGASVSALSLMQPDGLDPLKVINPHSLATRGSDFGAAAATAASAGRRLT